MNWTRASATLASSLLIAALLALSGCGGSQPPPAPAPAPASAPQPAAAKPAALKKVSMRLDWKIDARHSPIYYALQQGWFKEKGIDLEVIPGSGSADALKLLGIGKVDFALVDAPILTNGVSVGVPVKAVAVYWQKTPTVILSLEKDPIRTPKDLIGKKVGVKRSDASYIGFLAMLSAQGISQDQVKMIDIGFGVQPLLVGQVDALTAFTFNEPIDVSLQGQKPVEFSVADYGVKLYGTTLATTNSMIAKDPQVVRDVTQVFQRALEATSKDPTAALASLKAANPDLNLDREKQVYAKMVKTVVQPPTGKPLGWSDEATWQQTIDILKAQKLIDKAPTPAEVYTNEFLAQ